MSICPPDLPLHLFYLTHIIYTLSPVCLTSHTSTPLHLAVLSPTPRHPYTLTPLYLAVFPPDLDTSCTSSLLQLHLKSIVHCYACPSNLTACPFHLTWQSLSHYFPAPLTIAPCPSHPICRPLSPYPTIPPCINNH